MLVNNGGVPNVGPGAPFWQVGVEQWQRMVHTNTDGVFFMARAVAPAMIAQKFGKIVNVSTGAGTMVRKNFSPYGPSKAFLEAASRIWAQDLAGTGVTVERVAAGRRGRYGRRRDRRDDAGPELPAGVRDGAADPVARVGSNRTRTTASASSPAAGTRTCRWRGGSRRRAMVEFEAPRIM